MCDRSLCIYIYVCVCVYVFDPCPFISISFRILHGHEPWANPLPPDQSEAWNPNGGRRIHPKWWYPVNSRTCCHPKEIGDKRYPNCNLTHALRCVSGRFLQHAKLDKVKRSKLQDRQEIDVSKGIKTQLLLAAGWDFALKIRKHRQYSNSHPKLTKIKRVQFFRVLFTNFYLLGAAIPFASQTCLAGIPNLGHDPWINIVSLPCFLWYHNI